MVAEREAITVRSMMAADINKMTDAEFARVFFIVGFGVAAPTRALPCGFVNVALPALNGSAPYEVWFADEAVTRMGVRGMWEVVDNITGHPDVQDVDLVP